MIRLVLLTIVSLLILMYSTPASAKGRRAAAASFGRSLAGMAQKPLEVKGQTRTLFVPPTTAAEKDQISFVKRRTNYHREIKTTPY